MQITRGTLEICPNLLLLKSEQSVGHNLSYRNTIRRKKKNTIQMKSKLIIYTQEIYSAFTDSFELAL